MEKEPKNFNKLETIKTWSHNKDHMRPYKKVWRDNEAGGMAETM